METNPKFTHEELIKHSNHRITVTTYGLKVVLECMTCADELYEVVGEVVRNIPPESVAVQAKSCDGTGDCENCGS